MIVTHIDGRSEHLTDYKSLQRKRRVNGEYSLSFLLVQTERNKHSYPLTVEESLIEYDGQTYRIKNMSEKTIGDTPVKQIQADHTFFDLVDEFQYETISGAKQLGVCIAHALVGTGYTFDVVDSFASVTFENYGNDNPLSLIQIALNRFAAEIEINKKHLKFYRQIGRKTDNQFRYKHNIKTIEKYVDSSNLSTYIKGFGKQNEDGTYAVTAEYLSPLHTYYGKRHAKPVYDERYTTQAGLLERLRYDLQDTPNISIKLEAVELEKAGINTEQIELGDEVFTIYEPLNIDINARIVEIIEYPEESTSNQFTIANVRGSVVDSIADFQRTKDRIDGIFEGKEKLPYNVLDDAVIRATEALKSAQTQLDFENGILAIDPSNPSRMVLLNSKGIGISKNGGASFTEAITADGFVLSAGAIGHLKANNIDIGDVINTINGGSTKISGGVVSITNNQDFKDTKSKADGAKLLTDLWKDPNTTEINGGRIKTNSIDVAKLIAGILTGFVIQTDNNLNSPRIYMGGSKFEASNGSAKITIDTQKWEGYAGLNITSGNTSLIQQVYDNRATMTGADLLEIWMTTSIVGSLDVQGGKNASVPTSIGMVNISAYETAEYYFGDIGRGEVVNGECIIEIESLFKETVNTNIDYEVFITPYGKGLIYVDEMTPNYFVIKGDDIPFAYEIKAKRKGYETVRLELTKESEIS